MKIYNYHIFSNSLRGYLHQNLSVEIQLENFVMVHSRGSDIRRRHCKFFHFPIIFISTIKISQWLS